MRERLSRIAPKHILEGDREIWQPTWKCYCCLDTGIVDSYFITQIIPDHKSVDPLVACRRLDCEAGNKYRFSELCDTRFKPEWCEEFHQEGKNNWDKYIPEQLKLHEEVRQLTTEKNLRSRPRTDEENILAQRKHEEVLNRDPKVLKTEVISYLGTDFIKNGAS